MLCPVRQLHLYEIPWKFGGASTVSFSLGSGYWGYHPHSCQQMDCGNGQGGVSPKLPAIWAYYSSWGEGDFSLLGLHKVWHEIFLLLLFGVPLAYFKDSISEIWLMLLMIWQPWDLWLKSRTWSRPHASNSMGSHPGSHPHFLHFPHLWSINSYEDYVGGGWGFF